MADALARLRERGALVTGASRGIGRAVAAALARAGARVVLVARGAAELEQAARELGGTAVAGDVASESDVQRIVAEATGVLGDAPHALVNAAGAFRLARIAETEPAHFEEMLAVNVRGPFLLARALLPAMLARGSGHVVSIGSIAGRVGFAENGAYAASKFALRGLHAVLDAETRGTGVRATLVEPAATDTALWDAIDYDAHANLPPRAAMMQPDAVAEAVLYALAQPDEVAVRNVILERS